MTAFLAVLIVGVGTYFTRSLFILALARRRIPDSILMALQSVAPAALAALVVMLLTDGSGNIAIGVPELSAFGVSGAAAYKSRSYILALGAGMTVYWVIRALL